MAKELADIIYRNPKTWVDGDAYGRLDFRKLHYQLLNPFE